MKSVVQTKLKKVLQWRRKQAKTVTKKEQQKSRNADADYGIYCQKPDLSPEVYEEEKKSFLEKLKKNKVQRKQFERNTVSQADNALWLEERMRLLTASNSLMCVGDDLQLAVST